MVDALDSKSSTRKGVWVQVPPGRLIKLLKEVNLMAKKNKSTAREMETQEQKEARWAKNEKMARSFAKQAGLLKAALAAQKKKKLESSVIDY